MAQRFLKDPTSKQAHLATPVVLQWIFANKPESAAEIFAGDSTIRAKIVAAISTETVQGLLPDLLSMASGGAGGVPRASGHGVQPTYDTPSYDAKADAPSSSGGSEFDTMGRIAIIKHLRKLGVDYSSAKNVDELRALAKSSGGGGAGAPRASSGKQKWQTDLAREAAVSVLTTAAVPGGFVTRPSPRSSSGMVLCTWQNGKAMNLQINKDESTGKFSLKNCPFQSSTINEFISYFQGNTGGVLPIPLVILPQFQ